MAGLKFTRKPPAPVAAPSSDYGSDFDDDTVNDLLSQVEPPTQTAAFATGDLEHDPVIQDAPPALQRTVLLKRSINQSESSPDTPHVLDIPGDFSRGPQIEVEYAKDNRSAFSRTSPERVNSYGRLTRLTFSASQLRRTQSRMATTKQLAMLPALPLLKRPSNPATTLEHP